MPSIFAGGERRRALATLVASFGLLVGVGAMNGASAGASDGTTTTSVTAPPSTTTTTRYPQHCPYTTQAPPLGGTCPPLPNCTGSTTTVVGMAVHCVSTTSRQSTTVTTFQPCVTTTAPADEVHVMITCPPNWPSTSPSTSTTTASSPFERFWRWLLALLFGG